MRLFHRICNYFIDEMRKLYHVDRIITSTIQIQFQLCNKPVLIFVRPSSATISFLQSYNARIQNENNKCVHAMNFNTKHERESLQQKQEKSSLIASKK